MNLSIAEKNIEAAQTEWQEDPQYGSGDRLLALAAVQALVSIARSLEEVAERS